MGVLQGVCAYAIYLERKIAAYVQDRIGPNRVGPFGLLQPIADGLKFLFKEEVIPGHVDKLLYLLAPSVAVATAMLAFAVVPFGATSVAPLPPPAVEPVLAGPTVEQRVQFEKDKALFDAKKAAYDNYQKDYQWVVAPNIDIGILFSFSVTSLAVYAIVLGGYGSNNKYSFLGSLRSSAQLISYEIPLGMSILGVVLYSGSLNLEHITQQQVHDGCWNGFTQPLGFLLFMTGVFAECNRIPFDLPEAEQELVGGYHTEYSGMKFAFFFLGEYTHMVTTSLLMTFVFLGGWQFPGIAPDASSPAWAKVLVVALKFVFFISFYMFIRWTIPRFRFDQLMGLAWKVLIPLAMVNLVVVMIVRHLDKSPWTILPISILIMIAAAVLSLRMPSQTTRRAVVGIGVHGKPNGKLITTVR
jgi:NADH-quinone oxidoreductase subunit H